VNFWALIWKILNFEYAAHQRSAIFVLYLLRKGKIPAIEPSTFGVAELGRRQSKAGKLKMKKSPIVPMMNQ
jgi:hypothetical protein